MAISTYSEPSHLKNYARVVAFKPDLQRASFHGVTDFLPYSTTVKLLSEPQHFATIMGSHRQPYIYCGAQIDAGSPH